MTTFLNRFDWDDDTRLRVNADFSGTAVFHDGLAYDEDRQLVVSYSGSPEFYMQGIGFAAEGVMMVFDASGGLPADTFWQSGMPISAAENRLCVDPTNPVTYHHNGVSFTDVGAVAVNGGSTPPPPEIQTFDTLIIGVASPEALNLIDNLRFGTATAGGGYTDNEAAFLTDNPGLSLQTFEGLVAAGATDTVPPITFTGFSVVSSEPGGVIVAGNAVLPGGTPTAILGAADPPPVLLTFTFSPAISAVGLNLANSQVNPASSMTFEVKDGATSLTSQTVVNPNNYTLFTTFAGYASTLVVPTQNRVTADADTRVTADGDTRVWV